jgi:hypothetical protein
MKKAKVVLAMVILTVAASGCGIFQKKDKCPSVGQANWGMTEKK